MAVERDQHKIRDTFHGILNSAKDAWNTRADLKTGRYYVKGKPAHSVPYPGSYEGATFDYQGDPALDKK